MSLSSYQNSKITLTERSPPIFPNPADQENHVEALTYEEWRLVNLGLDGF